MIKLRQTLFLTIKSNDFRPYQQDSVKGTKDENLSVASDKWLLSKVGVFHRGRYESSDTIY